VRITVSHGKTKAEARNAVSDAADRVFSAALPGPLRISDVQKSWTGDQLDFSLTAGLLGGMTSRIKGFVLVTDRDITIDADLPALLTMLFPEKKIQAEAEKRIKGLLT
jgi:hypothetical protein